MKIEIPAAQIGSVKVQRRSARREIVISTLLLVALVPATLWAQTSLPPTLRNSIDTEFVLIPAGEFLMGSHDPYHGSPVRKVRISQPFYLGKYEVTQGQWEAVMGEHRRDPQENKTLPIDRVSWNEVQEFISKLNAREGHTKYRLPTEAQWEYAARAGTTTDYHFGNDMKKLEEYGWYKQNAAGQRRPVGRLKPNTWGLYDMHGNVWEWVQDWQRGGFVTPFPAGVDIDPQGPATGLNRLVKGGAWNAYAEHCKLAYSSFVRPHEYGPGLGFRLLRTAP